jgi:YVTN family beta-propeller protein
LPGQSQSRQVEVSIPNTTGCNCGTNITAINVASTTGLQVTITTAPSTPISGYCTTPFIIEFDVTALPNFPVNSAGYIGFEFIRSGGGTTLYANIGVNCVPILQNPSISLGELCKDGHATLKICNESDVSETFILSACSCEDLIEPEPEAWTQVIEPCHCYEFPIIYAPDETQEGERTCTIKIRANGFLQVVNLYWNEVYCEMETLSWQIGDINDVIVFDNNNFDTSCDTLTAGAIGERKVLKIVQQLNDPVVKDEVIYFSPWMFTNNPVWRYNFPGVPTNGFRYLVCDSIAPDGVYAMDWYGFQESQRNGNVTLTISNNGLTLEFSYEFVLFADALDEPNNLPTENAQWLLKNSMGNPIELNMDFDTSVYVNSRYASFVMTIERITGTFIRDFFNIKCRFEFYGSNDIDTNVEVEFTPVVITDGNTDTTDYLSETVNRSATITFNYTGYDSPGVAPQGVGLVVIRTDTSNNGVDPWENYDIIFVDIINGTSTNALISVVNPVSFIGGTQFKAHINVGANSNENARYRFILVAQCSTTNPQVRSSISRQIETVNYDDQHLPMLSQSTITTNVFNGKLANRNLRAPVNMQLESEILVDMSSIDTIVDTKSGGQVSSAYQALQAVELRVSEVRDDGSEIRYFNPRISRRFGKFVNDSELRGLPSFVNRSTDEFLNLVFPFTIPDNILRQTTSENWFNNLNQNILNPDIMSECQAGVIAVGTAIAVSGSPNLNGAIFIPELNQVWSCDASNHLVVRLDLNNFELLPSIALTASDTPVGLIYLNGLNKVYVACSGNNAVRAINIYTLNITTVSGVTGVQPQRFARNGNSVYYTAFGSDSVHEIDIISDAQTGSVTVGSQPIDIIFVPELQQIFVGNFGSSNVTVLDTALTVVATVAIAGQPFRLLFTPAFKVLATYINTIAEIDVNGFGVTTYSMPSGALGSLALSPLDGMIYLLCNGADLLCVLDPVNIAKVADYAIGDAPRDMVFADNVLIITNANSQDFTPVLFESCETPQPPSFSMVLKNIQTTWKLTFGILGNTEIYTYSNVINRVKPKEDVLPDFSDYDLEELDADGITWNPIEYPCPETGMMRITADFTSGVDFAGIAIEAMPERNNRLTEYGMPNPFMLPVESSYISNVATTSTQIQFEFDFQSWLANGAERSPGELYQDYKFNLHILYKL